MPANICVPLFKSGEKDQTYRTTAAVVGKTFAAISATIESGPVITTAVLPATYDGGNMKVATCGAGVKPDGVFAYDAASGAIVPVIKKGATVPVTSGAAITAGVEVMSDAAGKAIPWVTAASEANRKAGKATTTAGGADVDCYIELY